MQQNESAIDIKQSLVVRIIKQAIGDVNNIPWRISAQLLETKLLTFNENTDQDILDVIHSLENNKKYLSEHDSPLFVNNDMYTLVNNYKYIELTKMLSWYNLSAAELVAKSIKKSIDKNIKSDYTQALLGGYSEAVELGDLEKIILAASALDEALMDSWEWQLSILKQASDNNIQDIVNRQLSRLLAINPADHNVLTYLQSEFDLGLKKISPSEDEMMCGSLSTEECFSDIAPMAGHLPWRGDVGFGSVIENVKYSSSQKMSLWAVMEEWLENDRPAWWFHVWHTAVTHPDFIPDMAWPTIWRKLGALVGYSTDGYEQEYKNAARYKKLLEYYIYRLETCLPTARSDFVMWSSSKLASDVVAACSVIESFDEIIDQAFNDAKLSWQIFSPTFAATSLRSTFIEFREYWPSAIQASIIEWDIPEVTKHIPGDALIFIAKLIENLSIKLSVSSKEEKDSLSPLIIRKLTELRKEWKQVLGNIKTNEYIDTHLNLIDKYSTPESVMKRVSSPLNKNDVEGIVALFRLYSLMRDGLITVDQTMDLISSENWKEKVEPTIPTKYIEHIVEGMIGSQWISYDSLRVKLPHWAAQQCLANLDDVERRNTYLESTLLLSMKGNTTSAITRMIYEDKDNVLTEELNNIRAGLCRMLMILPSLVSSRVRSILASLAD